MNKGFLLKHRDQVLLIQDEKCSGANVVRHMKKILDKQIQFTDVIVYGTSDEILNRKAINYLKWHNNWHQPLRFRLRWNVYGFFFQHPQNTIIRSIACQLNYLDQFYSSDPDQMIISNKEMLIVGDLNHFGGWYCEYCYQPIDIIRKFHLDSNTLRSNSHNPLQSLYHRKPTVNIEYIESLILYGLYVDGKMQLQKYHNYQNTKYFTPEYVAKHKWKFDNIITNFYASWNDDIDY
jgi:beta-1,4-mannosyl-glycoprotein beta-1,4-N-acetylglucosaminyltransferase